MTLNTIFQGSQKWFELEDLHVKEILPQMIVLAESYIQVRCFSFSNFAFIMSLPFHLSFIFRGVWPTRVRRIVVRAQIICTKCTDRYGPDHNSPISVANRMNNVYFSLMLIIRTLWTYIFRKSYWNILK